VSTLVTAPGLIISGSGANELVLATIATTTLDGGAGNDCIVGGAMGETIVGGLGTDVCIGGPGTDVFDPTCETQVQ
jgi:Ca2+-binding RTX toxin-like protein